MFIVSTNSSSPETLLCSLTRYLGIIPKLCIFSTSGRNFPPEVFRVRKTTTNIFIVRIDTKLFLENISKSIK